MPLGGQARTQLASPGAIVLHHTVNPGLHEAISIKAQGVGQVACRQDGSRRMVSPMLQMAKFPQL